MPVRDLFPQPLWGVLRSADGVTGINRSSRAYGKMSLKIVLGAQEVEKAIG